jgi:hypothetical protein
MKHPADLIATKTGSGWKFEWLKGANDYVCDEEILREAEKQQLCSLGPGYRCWPC